MHPLPSLPESFYLREDVVQVARELLGKMLITRIDGSETSGIIVETEAYAGPVDRASHAWNNRRTHRTEVMYARGGTAYVYLCYGIHHLFNVVTNIEGIPHAILVRGLEPVAGTGIMLERRNMKKKAPALTAGPGALSKALGITTGYTGAKLYGPEIQITESDYVIGDTDIVATTRIGVDYAGADALLPYRFYLRNSRYVSRHG
jgi:DNA-3-methyladenine glycosylase